MPLYPGGPLRPGIFVALMTWMIQGYLLMTHRAERLRPPPAWKLGKEARKQHFQKKHKNSRKQIKQNVVRKASKQENRQGNSQIYTVLRQLLAELAVTCPAD